MAIENLRVSRERQQEGIGQYPPDIRMRQDTRIAPWRGPLRPFEA
jgi:hypothetical protein